MTIENIVGHLKGFLRDVRIVQANKATAIIEYEVQELEHVFSLLLFGSFIGMPSPPVHVSLQLIPLMAKEMRTMLNKVSVSHDALAELVSTLGEP